MTRDEALAALRGVAASVHETDEDAAAARLLQRLAGDDAPELQAALLEAGARAVLRHVRGEGR